MSEVDVNTRYFDPWGNAEPSVIGLWEKKHKACNIGEPFGILMAVFSH